MKRVKGTGLDAGLMDYLPQIIIAIFIVISGVIIVNAIALKDRTSYFNEDLWKRAYENVEKTKVGLDIRDITTSIEDYEQMRKLNNEYIERNDIPGKVIDVGVNISNERIYVDGNIGKYSNVEDRSMIETGPIYFQDRLLTRYINKAGELKIVLAYKDGNSFKVAGFEGIQNLNRFTVSPSNKQGLIDETVFIEAIKNSLLDILSLKDEKELLSVVPLYYTYECSKYLMSIRHEIVKDGEDLRVTYIDFGKADMSDITKNRVYIQVVNGDKVLNIILKLNENYKVFDVDII